MDYNCPYVDLLDNELKNLDKKPKGIEVSQELFDALKERGRITIVEMVLPKSLLYRLDGDIYVYVTDLPSGKPFRFPPDCQPR